MTDHPTFNPGFPVYIYQEGMELPKEGIYFLVSGNGLWLHKDMNTIRAFVPVANISVLQELDAEAWVDSKLPKLPAHFTAQIKEFFRQVVAKYRSEANVLVYYREGHGFQLRVSEQRASHGGVHYQRRGMIEIDGVEYLLVGTIHSHCDFGAFHSGTDVGDEETFDGIHCTFGHNDKDEFTISASIVVNGHRLKVDPLKLLEGVEPIKPSQPSVVSKFFSTPKHDEHFRLSESHEVPEELIQGWLENVKSWGFQSYVKDGFEKGDWVEWRGDMKCTSFREQCGDGPFEVHSVDKGMITFNASNLGLVKFSEKLFKLVETITQEQVDDISEVIQADVLDVELVEETETENAEENKED